VAQLDNVVVAPRLGGSVALDLRRGVYFELDERATEILSLVRQHGPLPAAETLATRYQLPVQDMRADVEGVLKTIRDGSAPGTVGIRRPTRRGTLILVRQWVAMPSRVKLAVTYAALLVVVVEILLHFVPLTRAAQLMRVALSKGGVSADLPPIPAADLNNRERLHLQAVEWAYRSWLYDGTCLRRALASGWVLRSRGPRLCLGLTGSKDVLAHAWLVIGDHSVDGLPGAQLFSEIQGSGTSESIHYA